MLNLNMSFETAGIWENEVTSAALERLRLGGQELRHINAVTIEEVRGEARHSIDVEEHLTCDLVHARVAFHLHNVLVHLGRVHGLKCAFLKSWLKVVA